MQFQSVINREQESQYARIAAQAFDFPVENWEAFVPFLGRENLRVLVDGSRVVGGLGCYQMGQWFGGRRLPMAGYALVAAAPERRGRGIARLMMTESLQELAKEFPIATLYASTQQLYRRVGFEQAGSSDVYTAPIGSIGGARLQLELHPVSPADEQPLRELDQARPNRNGCLDRSEGMWGRLAREVPTKPFAYVASGLDGPEGYVIYDQRTSQLPAWPRRDKVTLMHIRDMVATTPDAYESILAFVAGQQSMVDLFSWNGPTADPWLLRCAENQAVVTTQNRWMLRLLNVRQALEMRGYQGADGTVHFDIVDDLIESNCGKIVLHVERGKGTVSAGGSGAIKLDVAGMAPLFTGYMRAESLAATGAIVASDERQLQLASRVFAATEPWMPDRF